MEGGSSAGARAGGLGVRRRRRRGTFARVVAPPLAPAPSPSPPTELSPYQGFRQDLNTVFDKVVDIGQQMELLYTQREHAYELLDARTHELEAAQNRTRHAVERALRRGAVMALAMAEAMTETDLGEVHGFPEGKRLDDYEDLLDGYQATADAVADEVDIDALINEVDA